MKATRPPLPLRVLGKLLNDPVGRELVAELHEEFRRSCERRGPLSAHLWVWRQVLRIDTLRLVRVLRDRRRRPEATLDARRERPFGLTSRLLKPTRYAARSLLRRPSFALAIVMTFALGIGANTAIFSVIDGVLLEALPYPEGDRLVFVWGQTSDDPTELLSGPQAAEVAGIEAFERVAQVFGFGETSMVREDVPEPIRTLTVDHGFFDVLGVAPLLGRGFRAADEFKLTNEELRDPDFERPAGAMVLSYDFWQRSFGGDPGVLGRLLRVSGHRKEIVGVMPPVFRAQLPSRLGETKREDAWVMSPYDQPSFPRDTRFVRVIGRLPQGVDLEAAQRELDRLAAWQRATFPEDARDDFRLRAAWLQDEAGATARGPLLILLAAVTLVLGIACANVATLLLVRAAERDAELGLRRALGATRAELAWIGLVEGLLAAAAGGVVGIVLSPVVTDLLIRLAPSELPRVDLVDVDGTVLAFTGLLTLGVAVTAGALPALRSSASEAVGSGARLTGSVRERRLGHVLVGVEVALAVVLVTGTGLLLRSLANAVAVDPGFDLTGIYTWEANLTTPTHPTWASRMRYFRQTQEALLTDPRIRSIGIMTPAPFDGADRVEVRLAMDEGAPLIVADLRRTGPGALETLGVEAVHGRLLEWPDLEDFDRLHAVVDERFARRAWPGGDAVGQVIGIVRREYGEGSRVWDEWKRVEVVGVVPPIRGRDVRFDDLPTVYVTYSQNMWGRPVFLSRTDGAVSPNAVREIAAEADPRPLLADFRSLEALAGVQLAPLRFALTLIGVFGALGVALASTGVYAVLSYSVRRRERELNIRAVLGATGSSLSAGVVRSGLTVTAAGIAVGLAGAWWLTGFLESLLFGVTSHDPLTYVLVAGLVVVVATGSSWLPARRALRRNPAEVLR